MSDRQIVIETRDGEWCKPVVVNNWGYVQYFFRATQTHYGTWDTQDPTQEISAGDSLRVRWPDGAVSTEAVRGRSATVSVGDMGHTSEVTSDRLVVEADVHGVKVDVPIESLWVRRA